MQRRRWKGRRHLCNWRPYALAVLVAVGLCLAGCGTTPTGPVTPEAAITPTAAPPATRTPSPSSTAMPAPPHTLTPTHTPRATATPLPTFTPTPSATPTPTPPPISTPVSGEPLSLSLGGQFSANGHLTGGSMVYDSHGSLSLLSSLGRSVYALDGEGQVVWQLKTGGPVYGLAVIGEDKVATGDDAGYVTVIHTSGRQIWRHDLGTRVTAVLGWQGGVLAGGWDEALTLLGPGGEVQWQANLEGPVSGIAALPNLALAATLDGWIWALDAGGNQVWRFDAGEVVSGLTTVGQSTDADVLAGLHGGRLLALDAKGQVRWQQSLGAKVEGRPVWHSADVIGDDAPEIVAGTGGVMPLLALLSAQGDLLWRIAMPSGVGAVTSIDLDADGGPEILVGLNSGEIQAYDGQGRLRGSVHAGLAVWGLEAGYGVSTEPPPDAPVLVRADVVAWRLTAGDGPRGGPWLPPPAMIPAPPAFMLPGVEGVEGAAILAFLGDVAPGRSMEMQLARYGAAYPWEGLSPLLQEADLAVVNLESMLTTRGEPLNKRYLIRAHPRWGETLVEAGVDLVTVANNHALDYGDEGLDETLETLEALGIATVGAGRSGEEAHRPAVLALKGVRVAVLGYAAARWDGSVDVPATERVAWAVPAIVQADVRAARAKADVVIVLLHAGTEYADEPSADQMAVARAAVAAGADLVVGHHPHVTQTVEQHEGGLIVYSLGDALFDIPRPAAMQGELLRVHVTREGLVQAELWPFWIEDAIRPRLLDGGQGAPRFEVVYP